MKNPLLFPILILLFSTSVAINSQNRIPPLTKIDADAAAQNYMKYCMLCHGEDREGNAADYAPSLKSNSLMSTIPLNFLASSIAFGRPNTPMAAYIQDNGGPMTMKEIFNMAIWLKQKSGAEYQELSLDPISGDLDEGLDLYLEECASCHGKKGEGKTAPALSNPAFLAFATDHYIKYAIENGRESTKMKAYEEELDQEDIDNLTAYIRSLASGWSAKPTKLAPYPKPENYVINPKGKDPDFELIKGRYVPMNQVMTALDEKKKLIILDTRTSSEWHNAHIPGAIPIPYYISAQEVDRNLPNDGSWIIAYCACPHAASDKIIDMLRNKGYQNTAVIDEGFFNWINAGYPVTGGQLEE